MEGIMKFNNINDNFFFKFPIKMVFDGRWAQMSNKARSVFGVLGAHVNWKSGECKLALKTIAGKAGFCRRTAINAVHELEQLKVIFVKRTQGYVNQYVLTHYITTHTSDDNGGGDTRTDIPEEDNAQQELHFDEKAPTDSEPEENTQEEQKPEPETRREDGLSLDGATNPPALQPTETIQDTTSQQQPGDRLGERACPVSCLSANTDEVVQDDAPTSEPDCTTPCITMHPPVQPHAPKQENKKPDRISDNKNTAPKSEEWYRSLSTESQSSVLCCTRAINDVFTVTFGKYVPALIIMEKLMEGHESQFLMDIVRHANVPMITNPVGWFRSISASWHVKGETEEEYWRRLACHGVDANPILVSDEIVEQNPELAEDMEGMVPMAMQVFQLAVRYNSTLSDAKMLEELATEGDSKGEDTTRLWKNYEQVLKQIDRTLTAIQAFGHQYAEEEREKGFDMEALKTELKTWEQ